jgi:hypothetical protein
MDAPATRYCDKGFHDWERELRLFEGVECVVQSCRHCGVTEVCWSPTSRDPAQQPTRRHGSSRHGGPRSTGHARRAQPLQLS